MPTAAASTIKLTNDLARRRMEPAATSLLVPAPTPKLGQIRRALWWAFWAILSLVTGDLALVGADFYPTYGAIWLFCLCLTWHRRDDDDPERRRVRLAALAVSLLLGASVGLRLRVVGATPRLPLKVALLVLNGLSVGLAFYFLFPARRRRDDRADDGSLAGEGSPRGAPAPGAAEGLTA